MISALPPRESLDIHCEVAWGCGNLISAENRFNSQTEGKVFQLRLIGVTFKYCQSDRTRNWDVLLMHLVTIWQWMSKGWSDLGFERKISEIHIFCGSVGGNNAILTGQAGNFRPKSANFVSFEFSIFREFSTKKIYIKKRRKFNLELKMALKFQNLPSIQNPLCQLKTFDSPSIQTNKAPKHNRKSHLDLKMALDFEECPKISNNTTSSSGHQM